MSNTNPYAGLPQGAIVFGPKANCTLDICPVQASVFGYRPNLAANTTFIVLFALAGIVHTYLGIRWRSWFFMGCMLLGCVSASIGYIGRVIMWYNPFNFGGFMLQITCVGTAPVYFSGAIYVTLALAISHFSPTLSRFKNPKLFYVIFIPCDFLSLVVQAVGGVLSVVSSGTSQLGVNLALFGLAFQVFTMVVFCGFFGDYLVRYYSYRRRRSSSLGGGRHSGFTTIDNNTSVEDASSLRLKLFFGFLALAIVLITTRCVYRLVELNEGYRGHLVREEPLFIGLEGVIIILSVICLMVGHPGLVFKQDTKKENVSDDSHELVEGPKISR
ncbi:parasitic phase-specific protein PSP-1 [Podospora didyma]|uniref:Parasitic phase-specific protein PSP-1 n=1 Tax=Podospora didyma TaxID=330526 RepID=A0AAE0NG25_9PEZI|nr:parasitic phase-specific protein PSP-1 [Podospora didyma]